MFHALTGYWCPFCGGTRATVSLLHGDWAAALGWNPIAPLVELLLIGLAARLVYRVLRERLRGLDRVLDAFMSPREALVLGVAVAVFTVLRNTPWLQPWLAFLLGPPTAPLWG
ncbi:Protein of uncharacterised function (DUF2752) [Actinomyces bovis]|uniref:Protein of uncharacterized function (DUF2752) n=1 Tax=Actinomyces bovis TaxID=1658 RepID=A0ABY1VJW1_9ACTO|nr:Protein of uncharacterised function (DUF2752) [Actinomyces bovis]VEG53998.1 Protein of uncharacterised function (DUF2752) [Actinomyces israelii]